MFKFLFKRERKLEALIYEYLYTVKRIQDNFSKALNNCLIGDYCEETDYNIEQTHKYESKADDIIEEVNTMMYAKALVPESRGDILKLLTEMDKIPHLFEEILSMVQIQKLEIPEFLNIDIQDLMIISLECSNLVVKQVMALFDKKEDIRNLVTKIDTNESHCDHIERTIMRKIFDSDIDPFQKLQLKEMIQKIGNIADQADRVSKMINIIHLKRRV